ncbi:cysteine proteinase inhibitor 5-like [Vicia villosa]|uniref:cysteine proteinase inhibitor 5-like n=1 Tax=Vicia villosa TaxID=3911 RepID=UPI00273AF0A6|nr:cysteine proteinase inhibitor 5-like [Vicia villosa]
MKLQYVVLLLVVLLASAGVKNQVIASVWTPIKDINDPHVINIAKYAVTEQDKKAKLNLKLDKVISGETKVADGTTYCLNISASDNTASNKYNVVVLEKQTLTSFVSLKA